MQPVQSKITPKGERIEQGRAKRYSTDEVHQVLFPDAPPGTERAKTLGALKQGIRQHIQRRHAGD